MLPNRKLLDMVSSPYAQVRSLALDQLREVKVITEEIIQTLEQASHHEDPVTAQHAQEVLQYLSQYERSMAGPALEPDKPDILAEASYPLGSLFALPGPEIVGFETSPHPEPPTPADSSAQHASQSNLIDPPAGVFRRGVALFLDMLILAVICIVIGFLFGSVLEYLGFYTRLISAAVALLYFSYGNSIDSGGATPGKRRMHLSVRDANGGLISFKRSMLRSSILVLFFLFSGWQLPIRPENIIAQLLMSVLYFGLGGAIVYLILFNRKTGQNLDDMLVGTRVIYDKGAAIESYAITPRKHVYGAIAILILLPVIVWGISKAVTKTPVIAAGMEKIMPLYNAVNQDQRFYNTGVSFKTLISTDQERVNYVYVTLFPRSYLTDAGRQLVAQDVAEIAQQYIVLSDGDFFQVRIVSGYDLGFFSRTTVWICAPPSACTTKVVTTSILRLFSTNMTYVLSQE